MKFLSFHSNGVIKPGVLVDSEILDLTTISSKRMPNDLLGIAKLGEPLLIEIARAVSTGDGRRVPLQSVQIAAPIANPPKIVGIGFNYADHAVEYGVAPPKKPVVFGKFSSSVTGPNDIICWSASLTQEVDYEVELGVVIGKPGRNISEERALDHVFGYMVVNDLSARDLQFADEASQWDLGKSIDGFFPCGPYLVTKDEIPNPQALALECRVNGTTLQKSNTTNMIFTVRKLIAHISRGISLNTGDVIATGTPPGIGMCRNPKIFLRDGDECVCEIAGLGAQKNRIVVEL